MSVKIKINWDNKNILSESVRIYRADSAFTSSNLPQLLAEITDDVYEYEDLDVVQNQTYFYMLSAKLGEQEVFTECYEVNAKNNEIFIDFATQSLTKIFSLGSSVIRARGLCKLKTGNYIALVFESSNKLLEINASGAIVKTLNLGSGDVYTCQFTSNGSTLHVFTASGASAYRRYTLSVAYDISTATQSFSQNTLFTDQNTHQGLVFASPRLAYALTSTAGALRKLTFAADYDFSSLLTNEVLNNSALFSTVIARSLFFSKTGKTALMSFGGWQSSQNVLKTYALSTPFDMSTASSKKEVAIMKPAGAEYIFLCGGVFSDEFALKKEFYFGDYLRDFQKVVLS